MAITPSKNVGGTRSHYPRTGGKPSVPGRFDSKPGVSIPYLNSIRKK